MSYNNAMQKLINALYAYIKFLEDEIKALSVILLHKNNIIPDPEAVDRGEALRKAIRELSGEK